MPGVGAVRAMKGSSTRTCRRGSNLWDNSNSGRCNSSMSSKSRMVLILVIVAKVVLIE